MSYLMTTQLTDQHKLAMDHPYFYALTAQPSRSDIYISYSLNGANQTIFPGQGRLKINVI